MRQRKRVVPGTVNKQRHEYSGGVVDLEVILLAKQFHDPVHDLLGLLADSAHMSTPLKGIVCLSLNRQ